MGYRILDLDLAEPLPVPATEPDTDGLGLIFRWRGRLIAFKMLDLPRGQTLSPDDLSNLADDAALRVLATNMADELGARWQASAPPVLRSLSIVICTKDRAVRLKRLLLSLDEVRKTSPFTKLEVLVVDNASIDDSTREAATSVAGVRYVFEPRAGLNFARNAALENATGDLIAYLDDDVVVDRNWLHGLAEAWRGCPHAGGFTGLVLPYRLDTEAQIYFEKRGGFGRGFVRNEFRASRFDNPLHPVGAGILGAGCNMCFDRSLLIALGGFDEALDTGAPLPGGGDLDIFYRVLRSGRTMVYEPQYAVYHEHRETLAQLKRQYWSWGLGMMAFLVKSKRTDPDLAARHAEMVRWWFGDQLRLLAGAALRRRGRELWFGLAEIWGGIQGLAGEYDRSRARIHAIRNAAP